MVSQLQRGRARWLPLAFGAGCESLARSELAAVAKPGAEAAVSPITSSSANAIAARCATDLQRQGVSKDCSLASSDAESAVRRRAIGIDARCYGTRRPHKNIRARREGSYHIFIFPARVPRARAEIQANQQCHFQSSRWCIELLDTDSCHGTVPMEPPMSKSSMHHQNPDLDFDDTGQILQGASCTIAAVSY
jgi:hypothetical protein